MSTQKGLYNYMIHYLTHLIKCILFSMHSSTLQIGFSPDKQEKFFLHLVVFCKIYSF
jgi:hypothetical protein